MRVTFVCRQCGQHRLEEVRTNGTIVTVIDNLLADGTVVYGDWNREGGDMSCFRCANCQQQVVDAHGQPVTDRFELIEILRQQ